MTYLFSALIGYLLGSINTSVILSKFKGKDVRKEGSGNAGATNTLRVFGKSAAAIVVLGDILKTVIAILFVKFVFADEICTYLAALSSVLGHNFPLYFGFNRRCHYCTYPLCFAWLNNRGDFVYDTVISFWRNTYF